MSKYRPGESGNPAGRPVGSGIVGEYRRKLQARLPEVIDLLTTRALEGEPVALKLYLDRVLPALKPESTPVSINLPEKANLTSIGESIIQSVTQGAISVEAGAQLMSALTGQAKLVEVTELEARISAIEAAQAKPENE